MPRRSHNVAPPVKKPVWPYPHITRMTGNASKNQWVKRIRGRLYNFGVLDDPAAALEQWQHDAPALEMGEVPDPTGEGADLRLSSIIGLYLQSKAAQVEAGELTSKALRDYRDTAAKILDHFPMGQRISDVRPTDWEQLLVGLPLGPTRKQNFVVWTRSIFRWAHEAGMIDVIPRYGRNFRGPPMRDRRHRKHAARQRLFDPRDIMSILNAAPPALRAMVLLGINGGMGNTDCAMLPSDAINARLQVIDWPRPKTGIERVVPLWPETTEAMKQAKQTRTIAVRREDERLCFLTRRGNPWIRGNTDSLGLMFRRLAKRVGVAQDWRVTPDQGRDKELGVGFYDLRRTFRTIAEETGDQHAIHRIMGHTIPGMSGVYIQRIRVEQLRLVTDHVHHWLYGQ